MTRTWKPHMVDVSLYEVISILKHCEGIAFGQRTIPVMGDSYAKVRVAAVQAASVFLDREGSTEKACRLIREAGEHDARVIAFPEGFIPAHPVWYHHHAATGALANRLSVELFKNAVEIPGREVAALAAAARE